jgi:hypothetical protein
MRRFRVRKHKPGFLTVYWGITGEEGRGEWPKLVYAWGAPADKWTLNSLMDAFERRHPRLDHFTRTFIHQAEPSLVQILEERGYDITTLKFSIQLKAEVAP